MHVKSETIKKRGATLYTAANNTRCRGVWLECVRISPSPVLLMAHGMDRIVRTATVVPGASQLIYLKDGVAMATVAPQTGDVACVRYMVMSQGPDVSALKSA